MSVQSKTDGRIEVAICGEVKSGKTSLINAILRGTVVPDLSNFAQRPVVRVSLGQVSAAVRYLTEEGTQTDVDAIADIPTDGSVTEITIAQTDEMFGPCDLIEYPALRDGHVKQAEITQIGACDVFVWMTIGSQAWRLSEKTIIDKFTDRQRDLSLLAVSRADKFQSAADQDRLTTRLSAETSAYFGKGAMLGAAPKALLESRDDDAIWESIGGRDLAATLDDLVTAARARPMTAKTPSKQPVSAEEPDALSAPPGYQGSSRVRRTKKYWRGRGDPMISALEMPSVEDGAQTAERNAPGIEAIGSDADAALPEPIVTVGNKDTDDQLKVEEQTADASADAIPAEEEAAPETDSVAQSVEGLVSLATFNVTNHANVDLISGSQEHAQEFATHFVDAAQLVMSDPVFDEPESVHLTLKGYQILFAPTDADGTVLMLVCKSANTGLVRSTFARMTKHFGEAVTV